MSSQEQRFWGSAASQWVDHKGLFGSLKEPIFGFLREELKPVLTGLPRKPRIVNLGSGANNQAYLDQRFQPYLVAIDLSRDMLRLNPANRKAIADANRPLPLADNTIDLVVSFFLMRYLDQPSYQRLLAEIKRVLKPGANFFIADLVRNQFPHQKSKFHADSVACQAETLGFHEVVDNNVLLKSQPFSSGYYTADIGTVRGRK